MDEVSPRRQDSRKALLVLVLLLVLAFLLYWNGLNTGYYGDDFYLVFEDPASVILPTLDPAKMTMFPHRPINNALLGAVQALFGWNTVPIHIAKVTCHALLSWLVYLVLVRLEFSRLQAITGALFMLLSQGATSAVGGCETFIQISAALFGCTALYLAHLYLSSDAGPGVKPFRGAAIYLASVLCFAMALASKEDAVAYLPMLAVLFAVHWRTKRSPGSLAARYVALYVPYVVLAGAYIVFRILVPAGPRVAFAAEGRYALRIGSNILLNLAAFAWAALQPVASPWVFAAAKSRELVTLGLSAGGAVVLAGVIVYGLFRSRRYATVGVVLLLAFCSPFPVVLLNHVSELYVYNSLPFVAALAGIGLGAFFHCLEKRVAKVVLAVFLLCLAGFHIVAVQYKVALMKENGRLAGVLLPQVAELASELPPGGKLVMVNTPRSGREYSVYVVNGFDVLGLPGERAKNFKHLLARKDITFENLEFEKYQGGPVGENELVLFLDGETVRAHRPTAAAPKPGNGNG